MALSLSISHFCLSYPPIFNFISFFSFSFPFPSLPPFLLPRTWLLLPFSYSVLSASFPLASAIFFFHPLYPSFSLPFPHSLLSLSPSFPPSLSIPLVISLSLSYYPYPPPSLLFLLLIPAHLILHLSLSSFLTLFFSHSSFLLFSFHFPPSF